MIDLNLTDLTLLIVHVCVAAVFIIGLLCFFIRATPIRQIAGLKLMLQSVSLGLIVTGWERQDLNTAQAMVISALIIEAVVIGLALTMMIQMEKHKKTRAAIEKDASGVKWDSDG